MPGPTFWFLFLFFWPLDREGQPLSAAFWRRAMKCSVASVYFPFGCPGKESLGFDAFDQSSREGPNIANVLILCKYVPASVYRSLIRRQYAPPFELWYLEILYVVRRTSYRR